MHKTGNSPGDSHPLSDAEKRRLASRIATDQDAPAIRDLLEQAIGLQETAAALRAEFLNWKYWDPHPLASEPRSFVLTAGSALAAHAGAWPVLLEGNHPTAHAIHLIDWIASQRIPGAGVKVLSFAQAKADAVFSIGGSAMTRKMLPLMRFQPVNMIWFLQRALRPFGAVLRDSPRDWKMPARLLRGLLQYATPRDRLGAAWSTQQVSVQQIPAGLFPKAEMGEAVAARTAEYLAYISRCPLFRQTRTYLLVRDGEPVAYFLLAAVGTQVRLIDFGPNRLDEASATALGIAAQTVARVDFAFCHDITMGSTEESVIAGMKAAGLRANGAEVIHVRKLRGALSDVDRFRMTLLDWDAACL